MVPNPLDNLSGRRVILASASPRRKSLLEMLGIDFEVKPSPCSDESYPEELHPGEIAEYIALKKNMACDFGDKNTVIITADTIVRCGDSVLGKPADASEARSMLKMLSDGVNVVETGVAVSSAAGVRSFTATTEVKFAPLCNEEIEWYIDRYRPFDKAGAYGIQEWIGCIGISAINGSYYNVMGLPLHRLYRLLRSL